jgi:hypothetical protein
VQARIAEVVGHVTVPHKVQNWHPAIERLLKEDEKPFRLQKCKDHAVFIAVVFRDSRPQFGTTEGLKLASEK